MINSILNFTDAVDKIGLLGAVCNALGQGNRRQRGWRMCGNSICPPVAAALVAANCSDLAIKQRRAA